ncbi:MAG: DUF4105 domain-containing protein [Xanthomonadales bacterium]|nr:hypothetical protein [Xanthomonadales bacterium]MCC6593348.1 DUF4105 domain-containing protein [Xanthomonadales bacterium]MCE7930415.1 DUF4105 domain-containing protein [Xanthomonadales bacterium PRO6]
MSLRSAALWLALLLAAWAAPLRAEVPFDVSLVTVEPGQVYWQRFGHNAILLRDRATGRALSYNFGYFDFAQQDFLLRFLTGHMLYQAVALDGDDDLAGYVAAGRRVWVQQLRLPDASALALAQALHAHVQPENRDYRYDYYTINCSTKVRDALDAALGGALERATEHRSHGQTWRRMTRAHAQGEWWLYLGTDFALGQPVDQPLTIREEAFIPAELMRQVAELKLADGQPLVVSTTVLPAGADPEYTTPQPPDWRAAFAVAGIALAGFVLLLARLAERGGAWRWPLALFGGAAALLLGAAGLLLIGLWFGTDHYAAWRNQNLLLALPLWWLSLPAWALLARHERVNGRVARLAVLAGWSALAGVALAAFLKAFRGFDQGNLEWLLLLWPLLLAMHRVLARRCD